MPVLPDKQAMINHFLDDTWIWKPMRIFKNDAKLITSFLNNSKTIKRAKPLSLITQRSPVPLDCRFHQKLLLCLRMGKS
jgi:hypothetical protein